MIRLLPLLFILMLSFPASGQNDIEARRNSTAPFLYIPAAMETGSFRYVRTLQGSLKYGEEIYSLYKILRTEAKKLGANCYKLRSFVRNDTTKMMTLTMAVFFADELQRIIISNNQETNCLFLFSDDMFNNKKTSFELNDSNITVASGCYYKYVIQQNEEIKVRKGGFVGDKFKTKWEIDGPSRFLTVEGFKMSSLPLVPIVAPGIVLVPLPVGASTGKLRELDYNFGFLLTQILPLHRDEM